MPFQGKEKSQTKQPSSLTSCMMKDDVMMTSFSVDKSRVPPPIGCTVWEKNAGKQLSIEQERMPLQSTI